MRWKLVVMGLGLVAAVVTGCKQQCFLTECDYNHYRDLSLGHALDTDPTASIVPSTSNLAAPPTVLDPDRKMRPLSLAEATAMALEGGTVGSPALNGTTNTSLVSFQGRTVFAPESNIRVLALDPAIVGADIEASLSKFDAQWITQLTLQNTDQPTGGNFLNSFQNGIRDALSTSLLKPLPTGGVAGITFTTNYTDLASPPAGVINPSYRPILQFQFEQPLLQGFGVEINELRATHPGSLLTPFSTGGRVEGILITRLRFDQQRAEFERNVHIQLVNVEVAYWNLYGSYWNLYSREQGVRQTYEAWKINKQRYEAGKIPIQDFAQTRGQYELFRAQMITALGQVLENERALRALIALPVEDGTRLIPLDTPTLAPYKPDWATATNEALALRPELMLARQDLKFRQLDLINVKNLLLPDLRLTSTYDLNGFGTHLDGGSNDPNNAFHSLATDKFNDWSIGLRLSVPLGFRDAHAAVRSARLNLARSYGVLRDQEDKAQQFLALEYSNLIEAYEVIRAQRAQREATAIQLDARFKEFIAGKGTIDFLLEAQRVYADALRDEYNAIVQYNNSLAAFEFAKGTIMQRDNVVISEGGLPHCAQVRAVEHERERSKALVCKERATPVICPLVNHGNVQVVGLPQLPENSNASIPAILEGEKQLPPVPEHLPSPNQTAPIAPSPRPMELEPLPRPRPSAPELLVPSPNQNTPIAPNPRPMNLEPLSRPRPSVPEVLVPSPGAIPAPLPPGPGRVIPRPPMPEPLSFPTPEMPPAAKPLPKDSEVLPVPKAAQPLGPGLESSLPPMLPNSGPEVATGTVTFHRATAGLTGVSNSSGSVPASPFISNVWAGPAQ